jgi:hypothetical protein
LDTVRAISQDSTHIYIAAARVADPATTNPVVVKFPKAGGAPTVVATQDQFNNNIFAETGLVQTGGLTVDQSSGNIFVQFASFRVWRIGGGNQTPNLLLTAGMVESAPDYVTLIAGGIVEAANDWGIAADNQNGFLYISLESANSDTDSIIRIPQNPPPASANDWMLFE